MTLSQGVLIFVLTFSHKETHHFPSQDVSHHPLKCSFMSWPSQQARTILVAVSRAPFHELSCFSKANGPDASFLLEFLSCAVFSHSVVSSSLWPHGLQPTRLLMGILQPRILEWLAMPSCRDLLNPGIKPRSLSLQEDSLLTEPPGKPRWCLNSPYFSVWTQSTTSVFWSMFPHFAHSAFCHQGSETFKDLSSLFLSSSNTLRL